MINKRYIKLVWLKNSSLRFSLKNFPQDYKVKCVRLVGNFNGWSHIGIAMKMIKGVCKAALEANSGPEIYFR